MNCDVLEGVGEEGEAGWIRSRENLNMECVWVVQGWEQLGGDEGSA